MDEVYYLILKSEEDRLVNKFLVKDDKVFEFYVNQENSENIYVNQFVRLDDNPYQIDHTNDIFDEILKINLRFANLPAEKEKYELIKSQNFVGKYYPRIYRPLIEEPKAGYYKKSFKIPDYEVRELQEKVFAKKVYFPIDELGLLSSLNQLSLLTTTLHSIFQTIHPDEKNSVVYGHSIRNLLILACTEVESQLKGVLLKNGYPKKDSLSTNDYVKLKDVLALDKYKVKLEYYPLLKELSPFKDWNNGKPTESLDWYANYNATKHDRENSIDCGSIKSVLNAITAVAILIRAQYGEQELYWKEHVGGFFRFTEMPKWSMEEKYIPHMKGSDWELSYYFQNI